MLCRSSGDSPTLSRPWTHWSPNRLAATYCFALWVFIYQVRPLAQTSAIRYDCVDGMASFPRWTQFLPSVRTSSALTYNSSDLRKAWEQCPAPITESRVWLRSGPGHPCWAYCPADVSGVYHGLVSSFFSLQEYHLYSGWSLPQFTWHPTFTPIPRGLLILIPD